MDGLERHPDVATMDKLGDLLSELDVDELYDLWLVYCGDLPATLDDELLDVAWQDEDLAEEMIAKAEAIIAGRKEVAK